jgi:glycosyltransferase involved in cell wall biosynthesis
MTDQKNEKPTILWLSNASRTPTGYGNQTGVFTPLIKADGYPIWIFPFYGIEGSPQMDENGIVNLPRLQHLYGNDVVAAHYQFTSADAVITLLDPFVVNPEIYQGLNWVAWTPIDGTPVFPPITSTLSVAKRIWAMSKFGLQELRNAGFTNVDYVPHGVNLDIFKPIDRTAARNKLAEIIGQDLDGKYIVLYNAANKGSPSRKNFFETIQTFKAFSDLHDEALLWLHTDKMGIWGGELIEQIIDLVGLDPDKVVFSPQYNYVCGMLSQGFVNDLYNAADVYLHLASGEGFGIPILEAQAAGCPVIVTNFSAMPELCFAGKTVDGIPFMPATGYTQLRPVVPLALTALNQLYFESPSDQYDRRKRSTEGAQGYSHKIVYDKYMKPALEKALTKNQPRIVRSKRK